MKKIQYILSSGICSVLVISCVNPVYNPKRARTIYTTDSYVAPAYTPSVYTAAPVTNYNTTPAQTPSQAVKETRATIKEGKGLYNDIKGLFR